MSKREETFVWVRDVSAKTSRSVWDRITRSRDASDDDDDDLPGPNAGATLWPSMSRKTTAAFA